MKHTVRRPHRPLAAVTCPARASTRAETPQPKAPRGAERFWACYSFHAEVEAAQHVFLAGCVSSQHDDPAGPGGPRVLPAGRATNLEGRRTFGHHLVQGSAGSGCSVRAKHQRPGSPSAASSTSYPSATSRGGPPAGETIEESLPQPRSSTFPHLDVSAHAGLSRCSHRDGLLLSPAVTDSNLIHTVSRHTRGGGWAGFLALTLPGGPHVAGISQPARGRYWS